MEQAQPITSFDSRIDVYALAATTFYLLTGQDPINSADVSEKYINDSLPDTVSERTRNAIIHAMQPLRQYRTPTAADFLRELAASYTLPVGHVIEGPFDNYRITRILDDCGSHIRYEARRASENHDTTDLHATKSVGNNHSLTGNQSIVVLEQFVNGISSRNDDNSVTLGNIDENHKSQFNDAVTVLTGINEVESLPALTRGKGGMIEAMCFEANGTRYCVCNSSFKPQSAIVKSISNVADGATQVVGEVSHHVKTNYKLLLGIIVAGCLVGAMLVYLPKVFNNISKPETSEVYDDSLKNIDDVSVAEKESKSEEPQSKESTVDKQSVNNSLDIKKKETESSSQTEPAKVEKNKISEPVSTPAKVEPPKPATSISKPATNTVPKSNDNNSSPAATSQSQADKQAIALLSKLNASGTMPSASDMRRLNALRANASPAVQRRIDAFNSKWDY